MNAVGVCDPCHVSCLASERVAGYLIYEAGDGRVWYHGFRLSVYGEVWKATRHDMFVRRHCSKHVQSAHRFDGGIEFQMSRYYTATGSSSMLRLFENLAQISERLHTWPVYDTQYGQVDYCLV